MILRFYQPHPLLQSFVSNIMIYTHQHDRSQPLPVNLFPAIPEHSLYFYPRDPLIVHRLESGNTATSPPSIIVGPQVGRVNLSLGYDHLVIRVGFQVGGLHRLLRLPLHSIVDYTANSEDFMGSSIRETTDRLREAADFNEMNAIVEGMLLRWLSGVKPVEHFDKAVQALLKSGGNLTIEYLARESCLGLKQFERKCKERIGLSPKLFARIVRFSKAYRMREADPHISWTAIAHTAGYFDQMHLIRDFKVFAGTLPTMVDKELAQTPTRLQADLRL
jgi:AraC-like DNA-binding protein